MSDLSFGVCVVPADPEHGRELVMRMEDTQFDTAWVADTLGHASDRSAPCLDAWVALGALASETDDLDLGVLATNIVWRDPVQVARFAMSMDQITGGRFTLGLGCAADDDQLMAGRAVHDLSNRDRVDRLDEATQVIDRLLRGDLSDHSGQFWEYEHAAMAPGCVQQPRLAITLTGNGPRLMKMAARMVDTWNVRLDTDDITAFQHLLTERTAMLDDYLDEIGREPDTLGRSLLTVGPAPDPWDDPGAIPDLVERFAPLGFTEFILPPPQSRDWRTFLKVGVDVLGSLVS